MATTELTDEDVIKLVAKLSPYDVQQIIGKGTHAKVVAAIDAVLDREVAIKVLTGEPTGEYLKRFEREAKMQAKLNNNRHVVAIYSGGTFGGRHYLVMERMSRSLAQMPGPHSPAQVVRWLIQAADGLGALHVQGGVHCDVKLSNLLLAADGTLKVADFGIMALDQELLVEETMRLRCILGSPAYIAPEQWLLKYPSSATDVYALGVVAFKLLTGELPFKAKLYEDLRHEHLDCAPPRPANVPPLLADVALRCLAKKPADRYETMQELIAALQALTDLSKTAGPQSPDWVDPDVPTLRLVAETLPLTADRLLLTSAPVPAPTAVLPPRRRPTPTPRDFWGPGYSHMEPRKTAAVGDILYTTRRWSSTHGVSQNRVCIRYQDGHVSWLPIRGWQPDVSVQGVVAVANGSKIETIDLDGSDHRMLADMPGTATAHPRWSPDATRLAFTSGSGRYLVNADGSGLHQLPKTEFDSQPVSWSPDGKRTVVAALCAKQRCHVLMVVDLTNGDQTPLIPAWQHICNPKVTLGRPFWWPGVDHITVKASSLGKVDEIRRYSSTTQFLVPGDFAVSMQPVMLPKVSQLVSFQASAAGHGLVERKAPLSYAKDTRHPTIFLGSALRGEFLPVDEGTQPTFVNAPYRGELSR